MASRLVAAIFLAVSLCLCCSKKFQPTWESLDSRQLPKWYDDAKFGIFVHWGLYSVPSFGNEQFWKNWKDELPSVVEFIKRNYPPGFRYADFASQFKAELFDPNHWADLFSLSGAKYVVLTSKHHEGYTLWRSNVSWNWNAVDTGPHVDLIEQLSTSIRKRTNLRFGLYHSLQAWYNPLFEQDKASGWNSDTYVRNIFLPEMFDLVQRFKPDIIWADGAAGAPSSYWKSREFLAWLYNCSPVKHTVVANDRWGTDALCKHGDVHTCMTRYHPGYLKLHKWESSVPLDPGSWGYRRDASLFHILGMDEIVEHLVQAVSSGGNLLLNIGPTADGRIIPIFEERLLQMGEWLRVNGEGIYGTQAWRVQNEKPNIWYTSKGEAVYAIFLQWPKNDILVLSEPWLTEHTTAHMLGLKGKLRWKVQCKKNGKGIIVDLRTITISKMPCQWAWTIKLRHVH